MPREWPQKWQKDKKKKKKKKKEEKKEKKENKEAGMLAIYRPGEVEASRFWGV